MNPTIEATNQEKTRQIKFEVIHRIFSLQDYNFPRSRIFGLARINSSSSKAWCGICLFQLEFSLDVQYNIPQPSQPNPCQ